MRVRSSAYSFEAASLPLLGKYPLGMQPAIWPWVQSSGRTDAREGAPLESAALDIDGWGRPHG
eukprot:scaffold508801_cov17-Prasinocladus_malaysianus.AAC.1